VLGDSCGKTAAISRVPAGKQTTEFLSTSFRHLTLQIVELLEVGLDRLIGKCHTSTLFSVLIFDNPSLPVPDRPAKISDPAPVFAFLHGRDSVRKINIPPKLFEQGFFTDALWFIVNARIDNNTCSCVQWTTVSV
jgi:hypothetical protein